MYMMFRVNGASPQILGARCVKTSKGVPSPFIELELASAPGDTEFRRRTAKADANALCPIWHNETFDVDVCGFMNVPLLLALSFSLGMRVCHMSRIAGPQ